MSWSGVPLLRLLEVAVPAVASVALGVLAVRLRSKPRPTRRVAAVALVTIALALGLSAPSLFRPAIEGQEVLIGQRFAHYPTLDVAIRGVECAELCIAEVTGTNTGDDRYLGTGNCGLRYVLEAPLRFVGGRGTVYAPDGGGMCTTVVVEFPHGASDTRDVVVDVAGNGFVDLLDVRGSDEVVAVVMRSPESVGGPDHYALTDHYKDRPGRWAAVAVGALKLLGLATAGAAGAAMFEIGWFMIKRFKIKRRTPVPDLPPAGVVDPETAKRALSGLIRSDRRGRPDASE